MTVVVLGMHRSGTSAVTQLLEHAGLATCDARYFMMATPSNPHGNRENNVLRGLNDRLLSALGGSWSAPPILDLDTIDGAILSSFRSQAHCSFETTMPKGGWVWKDPRLCLLLPWWESVLDLRPSIVLVRRSPLEIATSLVKRDSFSLHVGLALWERYVRTALYSAVGHNVVIVDYSDIVSDPERWRAWLRNELGNFKVDFGVGSSTPATSVIDFRLRHSDNPTSDAEARHLLSTEQALLDETFRSLDRRASAFVTPELPPITAWATALLEERREWGQRCRALQRPNRRREAARKWASLRRYIAQWPALMRHSS